MKKLLALVLVLSFVFSGMAFADDKPGKGITIGVVYKQSGNPYFQAGVAGFQKAADELGFTFMHDGPDDGSSDGQIRIIENYIAQGVDVLCISANDPASLVDVCNEAREAGIKVVTWDAPVDPEGRDLDVEPASAKVIALTQLDSMVKSIGGEGQIAILSAMATAPNQNLWISFMQEALKSNDPKYAKIEFVGVVYGDDEYTKSFNETQALLEKYPNLKGIIVPTTVGAPAVSKCIMDAKRNVKVTGLTLASDMKEFINKGIADETFLWNPTELGYAASFAAVAFAKGEISGKEGETFNAGSVGTLTIEKAADGGTISFLNKLNVFNNETVDAWINIL
ncbi:MAG: substrate-binding domain-containing protein [Synergistaceae bacterium]|nr:substrate-binding domain-containing protein [Synergistaceae bacterium]MBQ6112233.1 substrate-binding domain-containing protein [Synergistaceae bacterium]